jgi:hypothetical protein
MDLQSSKIELVRRILDINDHLLVDRMLTALNAHEDDFWNVLSASEKADIKEGIRQLNAGQRISLDEFMGKVS